MRGIDMKTISKKEHGFYTIEASIALLAFVLAVMLVFSQIRVLIGECILQNAVNNMAKETASYVYILDRLGLIIDNSELKTDNVDTVIGEGKNISDMLGDGQDLTQEFTNTIGMLFSDDETSDGGEGNPRSITDSLKKILETINGMSMEELKQEAASTGVLAGEKLVQLLANSMMSGYYDWKLDAYLPMEREEFCKYFMIDGDLINFDKSRVFPTDGNNSILVAAEYDTTSPFKMFALKRHVIKYSYCAAWVENNTNSIK